MKEEKLMVVSAIKDGTVIDHVPAKNLFKAISILGLDKIDTQITFGTNLDSQRMGSKAIIKLSDVFFPDEDINKIALVAPQAKLNIIRNYKVVEKRLVEVPDQIIGFVKCYNPQCITNHEDITTKFQVVSKSEVTLRCCYCEKLVFQEHIEIR